MHTGFLWENLGERDHFEDPGVPPHSFHGRELLLAVCSLFAKRTHTDRRYHFYETGGYEMALKTIVYYSNLGRITYCMEQSLS